MGRPGEAIEQHDWDVNRNFVNRYVRPVPCVAQKQGPCYILKICMHNLKFKISVFEDLPNRNQSYARELNASNSLKFEFELH